jgi:beta-galactosidase/beta-glucuronidase
VGFRRISIVDGLLHLNGRPIYQRLVLDQGYWPDGHYTAPDDESIRGDIEAAMRMGFNGCRKHAKIEDPRFYYWADRLGYLVWEELPSAYVFTPESQRETIEHTLAMIRRDGTHPAVICWTLFNESWGIPDVHHEPEQQSFVRNLIETVRSLDPERLVVGNDGWEQIGGDVYGLHSYAPTTERLVEDLNAAFSARPPGTLINGRPFQSSASLPEGRLRMVTEFGGTGYLAHKDGRSDAWGYDNLAESPEDLAQRINSLVQTLRNRTDLAGFVYTQLTDVEQEVNGLLFTDRSPKIEIETIRKIILGKT